MVMRQERPLPLAATPTRYPYPPHRPRDVRRSLALLFLPRRLRTKLLFSLPSADQGSLLKESSTKARFRCISITNKLPLMERPQPAESTLHPCFLLLVLLLLLLLLLLHQQQLMTLRLLHICRLLLTAIFIPMIIRHRERPPCLSTSCFLLPPLSCLRRTTTTTTTTTFTITLLSPQHLPKPAIAKATICNRRSVSNLRQER